MKLVRLDTIFNIISGSNKDLNKLEQVKVGINYVSCTQKNNGVSAIVKQISSLEPQKANTISVAGTGSICEAFYQDKPYYSASHSFTLEPKVIMTKQEMLFYCMCIRENKFRYNFGRKADKTLGAIKVPALSEIPDYVNKTVIEDLSYYSKKNDDKKTPVIDTVSWVEFPITKIFKITKGIYYHKDTFGKGNVPLITSTEENNGVAEMTNLKPAYNGNCITIGKVRMSAFYQPNPFCCSHDVSVLEMKDYKLNQYVAMFIIGVLSLEKFRYDYGRQIQLNAVKKLKIRLPVNKDGNIDYEYMEQYIKTLPFTKKL